MRVQFSQKKIIIVDIAESPEKSLDISSHDVSKNSSASNEKPKKVQWGDDIVFYNQEELNKLLQKVGVVRNSTNNSNDGETIYYRCGSSALFK